MVYTIAHRQRASVCWSFISINIGLSCKRLVSWNHDNKNQPLSSVSWHVRQVWSISTPSLVHTLNTADIFIATVTLYYVLDDVFICLHSTTTTFICLHSTTKINFKFVSPLLFKILDHNVISITIAIVRMKEKAGTWRILVIVIFQMTPPCKSPVK